MTILVADSGATKTDWRLIEGKETIASLQSGGINPAVMGADSINRILWDVKNRLGGKEPERIFFYGAGVIGPGFASTLRGFFPLAEVTCESDLAGACRALFGDRPGIAAILGTGSNSCEWDGSAIVRHIGCGGFILGDEGSASNVGKMLLSDYVKELVPEDLSRELEVWYSNEYGGDLDYPTIVGKVYKGETPSAWVAGFGRFITARLDNAWLRSLVKSSLEAFAARNLHSYDKTLPVGIVGSFGLACKSIAEEVFAEAGFRVENFLKSPIEALSAYHSR